MRLAVTLLLLLSSVTHSGCAHCYDWSVKPRMRGEYGGGFKITPLTKKQCKAREERNAELEDARVCTVLEERYHLDVCWTTEKIEEEEDARSGEFPDPGVQPRS